MDRAATRRNASWRTVPNEHLRDRPTRHDLDEMKPGMYVRFTLAEGRHRERVWAEIIQMKPAEHAVRARLLNEPAMIRSIKHGDIFTAPTSHLNYMPLGGDAGVRNVNDFAGVPGINWVRLGVGAALVGGALWLVAR
jgi:hypothetical protein